MIDEALGDIPNLQPITQEIVYGVVRFYNRLEALAALCLKKPLKKKDFDVQICLLCGLYQLHYLNLPEFAAVNETVHCADKLNKPWAKGLINAVLRKFIRDRESLIENIEQNNALRFAHPEWLLNIFKQEYPGLWQDIATFNNGYPPLSCRVNTLKATREEILDELPDAIPSPYTPTGFTLATPKPVAELPGFQAGLFSIQDISASLAAPLLDLQPGLRVLDACAAPGGKFCHIIESQPNLACAIAIDISEKRLIKIKENCTRLGLTGQILTGDATTPELWWDNTPFDRILLDAPCSGSGVIRRHPDSKWHRKPTNIKDNATRQLLLLEKLWPLLKPQGLLLYATCSIFHAENQHTIEAFLAKTTDSCEVKIAAKWGYEQAHGRQILPTETMDGFYYCLLKKE